MGGTHRRDSKLRADQLLGPNIDAPAYARALVTGVGEPLPQLKVPDHQALEFHGADADPRFTGASIIVRAQGQQQATRLDATWCLNRLVIAVGQRHAVALDALRQK